MDRKRKKSHPLLTILLLFLAILILVFASPFIYDLIGGFDDYDDIPALIHSNGARALSVDADGIVSFSADKAAIYAYASEMQLKNQVLSYISRLPFCSEKTVRLSRFGYELNDASLCASARIKLFGLIPVQLHADADLQLSPDKLRIRLNDLKYGKWISIPPRKCAEIFGVPEFTDGFEADISDFFGALDPVELSVKGSEILFKCDILNNTVQSVDESGVMLATLMPILCGEDSDAARVLRGETADVYGAIRDTAALSELLTELLKFGSEADAEKRKSSLEDALFLHLDLGDVSVCSSGYSARLSEALREYESKLITLRDNYKELDYSLAGDGLYSADGLPAEAVLPEAWGARIVLQYNLNFDSIVKTNDGSLSGGTWIVPPLPMLSDLKRDGYGSLPNIPGIKVFDLTVAFRTANGTPAILFLTALDALGLNVISEQLYEEIVSSAILPVYCSSDIISPSTYLFVTPESSQRDLLCYLP